MKRETDANEAIELLNECNRCLEYRDGMLFWKINPATHTKAGDRAGGYHNEGYRNIQIHGKLRLEHRVIFLMCNGYLPDFIDHINGIRNDNRIENLRPATRRQNGCNSAIYSSNTSGVKGVYFNKKRMKWVSRVFKFGKTVVSKSFDTLEEAAKFRFEMERIEYGDFACQRM